MVSVRKALFIVVGNGHPTTDTTQTDASTNSTHSVTKLIDAWQNGDAQALGHLFDLTYRQLHELAGMQVAREAPDCTLQATSLVNEAFLRLAKSIPSHLSDRKSFFCTSARAMK